MKADTLAVYDFGAWKNSDRAELPVKRENLHRKIMRIKATQARFAQDDIWNVIG